MKKCIYFLPPQILTQNLAFFEGATTINSKIRTDLAMEAEQLFREGGGVSTAAEGIRSYSGERGGFRLNCVEILDERGERALGKPRGRYVTLELDALLRREQDAFVSACEVLAEQLRSFLHFPYSDSIFVAGLGNREITPDAIGPLQWTI